jgi:hypothetical protein
LAAVAGRTRCGPCVGIGLIVASIVSVGEGCGLAVMVGEGITVAVGCGVGEGVSVGVCVTVGVLVGVGCPPINQNPMIETEQRQHRTIKTPAAAIILLRSLKPWIFDHSLLSTLAGSSFKPYSYS